jgi:hypothetical protein
VGTESPRSGPEPDASPPGRGPTEEQIRLRAHEISVGPGAGTPEENWLRAELELVDMMRAEREGSPLEPRDVRREDVERAADEEAAALGHAHWFSQGHP